LFLSLLSFYHKANMKKTTFSIALLLLCSHSHAIDIPDVHPNIVEENGSLVFVGEGNKYPLIPDRAKYTLDQLVGNPIGTKSGIKFDFGNINGRLYYGFIKQGDGRYPQPVFYRFPSIIQNGQASLEILGNLGGRYDMIGWTETGEGTLGYRVVKNNGVILYDGKIAFIGKSPFKINTASIIEGPFINFAEKGVFHNAVRVSFDTLKKTTVTIVVHNTADDSKVYTFKAKIPDTHHEIALSGLMPNTAYSYTVTANSGNHVYKQSHFFKTAPIPGSRTPFVFSYASDSRQAQGGGERNIVGANAYIMKKIAALSLFKNAAFMQFTGDMINGYKNNIEQTKVEYRNWKRAIEPFAHGMPIVTTMGNHETVMHIFKARFLFYGMSIDRFPYETESAEAVFASQFVNPTNGPQSEDGAIYDPNPNQQDFPSYQENVFYYIYDNVAMIVLNSNYWYAPSLANYPQSGGNLHGYLMDKQLEWLESTMTQLDTDNRIDFVFVTHHTPAFPNGGHVADDMWYNGNNQPKAVVKHSPNGNNLIQRGIIEQRDKYLKIVMKSQKGVAMLTGDEHNFNWLMIDKQTKIYPIGWNKADIRKDKYFRSLYQINNGAAGAPYAAQEKTPWSEHVRNFTAQNALVFFHVHGNILQMEVLNPDTLDTIVPLQVLSLSKH
ncbi:metallophosphoesterase family protein, partial [Candidatus Parabeggiatoa sp. HSG14]|uniref:metallophosphoesterase family protein n=1 Tax=Candidatus Parabeggiatoa sp. HSG14 TaxID=3055593 RepID=UPI0025A86B7C|nr:metallophosphoesterase family protein [Thiotrichales bacterium HSG14]